MKTILTSKEIVAYVIADALEKVGIHPDYAETIGFHQADTNKRLHLWANWFSENCLRCNYSPRDCNFFNPEEKSTGKLTAEEVRAGNMIGIERGGGCPCPLLSAVNTTSNPDT